MGTRAKVLIAATTATLMVSPAAAYNQWGNYHWSTNGNGREVLDVPELHVVSRNSTLLESRIVAGIRLDRQDGPNRS